MFAAAAACHTCSCLPTPFAGPPTARNRLSLRCRRSPTCTNASQGKTGNSNCLCNLVPAPDSYRKAGLWARQVRQRILSVLHLCSSVKRPTCCETPLWQLCAPGAASYTSMCDHRMHFCPFPAG